MNELVLGRRAILRAAAVFGAGCGLAQSLPAWAQPLSKGLVRPLPTVSGNDISLAIGGSATNDGGIGMAQALGAHFLDKDGNEAAFGGGIVPQAIHGEGLDRDPVEQGFRQHLQAGIDERSDPARPAAWRA